MSIERLAGYVSGRGPAWYAATAAGSPQSRREVLRGLVVDLAALGEDAGTGQPPGTRPPVLGDHALADQLLVLGHELGSGPRAAAVAARAERLVEAARARL